MVWISFAGNRQKKSQKPLLRYFRTLSDCSEVRKQSGMLSLVLAPFTKQFILKSHSMPFSFGNADECFECLWRQRERKYGTNSINMQRLHLRSLPKTGCVMPFAGISVHGGYELELSPMLAAEDCYEGKRIQSISRCAHDIDLTRLVDWGRNWNPDLVLKTKIR